MELYSIYSKYLTSSIFFVSLFTRQIQADAKNFLFLSKEAKILSYKFKAQYQWLIPFFNFLCLVPEVLPSYPPIFKFIHIIKNRHCEDLTKESIFRPVILLK